MELTKIKKDITLTLYDFGMETVYDRVCGHSTKASERTKVMSVNPKVISVVVTYNRLTLLKGCIEALLNQDYENTEILIVDNNSTDGTREYVKEVVEQHSEKMKMLFLEKNIGGAGGFHGSRDHGGAGRG